MFNFPYNVWVFFKKLTRYIEDIISLFRNSPFVDPHKLKCKTSLVVVISQSGVQRRWVPFGQAKFLRFLWKYFSFSTQWNAAPFALNGVLFGMFLSAFLKCTGDHKSFKLHWTTIIFLFIIFDHPFLVLQPMLSIAIYHWFGVKGKMY